MKFSRVRANAVVVIAGFLMLAMPATPALALTSTNDLVKEIFNRIDTRIQPSEPAEDEPADSPQRQPTTDTSSMTSSAATPTAPAADTSTSSLAALPPARTDEQGQVAARETAPTAHVGNREGDTTTPSKTVKTALPNSWRTRAGKNVSNTDGSAQAEARASLSVGTQSTTPQAETQTLAVSGANLIGNAGFETAGSNGLPQGWAKGGFGTNTRVLSYPVTGNGGTQGARVEITSYTSGDAKWYFTDVPVTAGATYQFSNFSQSNATTYITVQFKMSTGAYTYKDIATVSPSSSFKQTNAQFVVPAGATSLTIFHVIKSVGSLTVDDYSLTQSDGTTPPPPPPPPSGNLVPNGNFESTSSGLPTGWKSNKWGTNTASFPYPVIGPDGSKAARVTISGYFSGDAKWFFNPIALQSGTYTYTDQYSSNVPSVIDVQFQNADGSFSYKDIAFLPATSGFKNVSVDFFVPVGTKSVTVFHLIQQTGSLTIDNASVVPKGNVGSGGGSGGIFTTGAVTFRFDDGIDNQYSVAVPKLDAAGFKGTFYIASRQIKDNGFSGYMTLNNIKDLANRGHEIGAHTRTHAHLTSLSSSQQQQEIVGSRQDIQAWGVGPVLSFAYPYGEYSSTTLDIVENAGFSSAAATIDGYVSPASDPYQLEYQEVNSDIPLAVVKTWIDKAAIDKTWLILTFHDIKLGGDLYSTTPTTFQGIVDYVKQKGLPVITTTQGRNQMP